MNLSHLSTDDTAHTNVECAIQRAENLAILGAKNVLELCVGPSLKTLEVAYGMHGITVVGNDIDPRWASYYPNGKWIIGDAIIVPWDEFDAIVFAPPLSLGCTGKREDALSINDVTPAYWKFMDRAYKGLRCMVLPARSLSTKKDREQFYRLMSLIDEASVVPLHAGSRKIRKYVDVYYKDVKVTR